MRRRIVYDDSDDDEAEAGAAAVLEAAAAAVADLPSDDERLDLLSDDSIGEPMDDFIGGDVNPLHHEQFQEDMDAWLKETDGDCKRVDSRPRKTERKNPQGEWTPLGRGQNLTEQEASARMAELAKVECSSSKWYGEGGAGGWRERTERNASGQKVVVAMVKVHRCGFYKESKCEARIRLIRNVQTGRINIERGHWPHCNHSTSTRSVRRLPRLELHAQARTRATRARMGSAPDAASPPGVQVGLPKVLQLKMSSPTSMALPPAERTALARRMMGADFGKDQPPPRLPALVCAIPFGVQIVPRCVVCRDNKDQLVPAGLGGRFGGVAHFVEAHSKEALMKAGNFGIHTVYVCGEAKIDVDAQV